MGYTPPSKTCQGTAPIPSALTFVRLYGRFIHAASISRSSEGHVQYHGLHGVRGAG